MNVDILKICALALVCVIVCVVSRILSGSVASAARIAGALVVFFAVMIMMGDTVSDIFAIVGHFAGYAQIADYWSIMLRALGIAILCRICTDVCRDCGETTIAGGVEMAGKITILALSLPMVEKIISYAQELLAGV